MNGAGASNTVGAQQRKRERATSALQRKAREQTLRELGSFGVLKLGRQAHVAHQHGARHGAHATRYRCDGTRNQLRRMQSRHRRRAYPASSRSMPTSMRAAPGLIQGPLTIFGMPHATTRISALWQIRASSHGSVWECATEIVALRASNMSDMACPRWTNAPRSPRSCLPGRYHKRRASP